MPSEVALVAPRDSRNDPPEASRGPSDGSWAGDVFQADPEEPDRAALSADRPPPGHATPEACTDSSCPDHLSARAASNRAVVAPLATAGDEAALALPPTTHGFGCCDEDFGEKAEGALGSRMEAATTAFAICLGDFFHNFTDGVMIGTAFKLCSPAMAWGMVAASVGHEVAQEVFPIKHTHTNMTHPRHKNTH